MNEKGFTLVETLVSLVVGAMLLGSISWVIAGLSKDFKSSQKPRAAREQIYAAQILDRVLSSARFGDGTGKTFPRSQNALDFRMHAPEALGSGRYISAKLSAADTANGKILMLQFPDADVPDLKLLSAMEEISFAYKSVDGPQGRGPFISHIAINYKSNDGRSKARINIHPRINAAGGCVFDPVSQQCRS